MGARVQEPLEGIKLAASGLTTAKASGPIHHTQRSEWPPQEGWAFLTARALEHYFMGCVFGSLPPGFPECLEAAKQGMEEGMELCC